MNENEIVRRLYEGTANENLRVFLRIVPPRNFRGKSIEEAKQYLISAYNRHNEVTVPKNYVEDVLQMEQGENFLKYTIQNKNSQE